MKLIPVLGGQWVMTTMSQLKWFIDCLGPFRKRLTHRQLYLIERDKNDKESFYITCFDIKEGEKPDGSKPRSPTQHRRTS